MPRKVVSEVNKFHLLTNGKRAEALSFSDIKSVRIYGFSLKFMAFLIWILEFLRQTTDDNHCSVALIFEKGLKVKIHSLLI